MAVDYKIVVKVVSQKGTCAAGHKVGDEWVIKGDHTPEGVCLYAFNSLFPFTQVLAFGGTIPWEPNPDVATVACTNAKHPVVFEVRRVRE